MNYHKDPSWIKKPTTESELAECLKSKMWRLHNLYRIINIYDREVLFQPNETQLKFLNERHGLDIILKARQLGLSTIVQIDMLDECLFKPNTSAGVIAHTLTDAKHLLKTKFKYPYESLPSSLKNRVSAITDSKETLEFSNGSIVRVGTSLRSSTISYLHVSEHAKICADSPDKAIEIRTGALNAVHTGGGQKIILESTAEGREGDFFRLCREAENTKISKKDLTELDFKFHFFPWWKDEKYKMPSKEIIFTEKMERYFDDLKFKHQIDLTLEQKSWYIKKEGIQREHMKREFPSTSKEAFEQAIEGAYFERQMRDLRSGEQIGNVPLDPSIPVNTFWDIGISDHCAIWFHQRYGLENRFVSYYENSGEGFPFYAKYLQTLDLIYGAHYLPHDANNRNFKDGGKVIDSAYDLLKGEIYLVERIGKKTDAIERARGILPSCYFDEKGASQGIQHLDNYRKEWNEHLGTWRNTPRHDDASHGADAFMTFATGYNAENDHQYAEEEDNQYYNTGINEYDERSNVTGY